MKANGMIAMLLIAGCAGQAADRPRQITATWVSSDVRPLAITVEDTSLGPTASREDSFTKTLQRSIYREDPTRGLDTLFVSDTLRLRGDGSGVRREVRIVRGLAGVKSRQDSTTTYSLWTVSLDSSTNRARLCLNTAGYGPRDCAGVRLMSDTLVLSWRSERRFYVRTR